MTTRETTEGRMFKHIYVPVDNSEYSNRAIDLAVELARFEYSELSTGT